jgi:hypothetical protein
MEPALRLLAVPSSRYSRWGDFAFQALGGILSIDAELRRPIRGG